MAEYSPKSQYLMTWIRLACSDYSPEFKPRDDRYYYDINRHDSLGKILSEPYLYWIKAVIFVILKYTIKVNKIERCFLKSSSR